MTEANVKVLTGNWKIWKKILNSWKRRKMTLLGKIGIVKSLGLSKLIIIQRFNYQIT